jgi:hypothetical protein
MIVKAIADRTEWLMLKDRSLAYRLKQLSALEAEVSKKLSSTVNAAEMPTEAAAPVRKAPELHQQLTQPSLQPIHIPPQQNSKSPRFKM